MDVANEALNANKAVHVEFGEVSFIRFTDSFHHVLRGTAVFDGAIIHGYPSIGRILTLDNGLRNNFENAFWAEEKIDGYNVRIFRHQGRLLALSRGGFICPFTSDRAADLLNTRIFDDHPDLVVCAEVAGPENPYLESSPPFIDHDVQLFVFDMQRFGEPGFLPHEYMYELVESYALPSVRRFGLFEHADMSRLEEIIRELNDQGREGVVFKEQSNRDKRVKYVTANSSIADIRVTSPFLSVPPPEYFIGRILRTAVFSHEQNLQRSSDLNQRLGAAFTEGLWHAIEQYLTHHNIFYTHRCRFHHKENALALIRFLHKVTRRQHVQIVQRRLEKTDGFWILEFDRCYPKMAGLFSQLLKGKVIFD